MTATHAMSSLIDTLLPLRSHIRQHLDKLRASPCLLISSSTHDTTSQSQHHHKQNGQQNQHGNTHGDPKVHTFVQRNTHSIQYEFNLPAIPITIHSAFPTPLQRDDALALAQRAGLKPSQGVVIGIGSGAAVDLAKAVSREIGGTLILAPGTLGGVWAASSKSVILLDTREELLLPQCDRSENDCGRGRGERLIALDPLRELSLPPLYHAASSTHGRAPAPSLAHGAAAVLAVVLDLASSIDSRAPSWSGEIEREVRNDMTIMASLCASVLNAAAKERRGVMAMGDSTMDSGVTAQRQLIEAIIRLSSLMDRFSPTSSIPQSLANALLPTHFPQCHILTYLACILPGLCDVLASRMEDESNSVLREVARSILGMNGNICIDDMNHHLTSLSLWASQTSTEAGIPTMASLAYGTPCLNTLVEMLDGYNALMETRESTTNSGDYYSLTTMEDVLQQSLNR